MPVPASATTAATAAPDMTRENLVMRIRPSRSVRKCTDSSTVGRTSCHLYRLSCQYLFRPPELPGDYFETAGYQRPSGHSNARSECLALALRQACFTSSDRATAHYLEVPALLSGRAAPVSCPSAGDPGGAQHRLFCQRGDVAVLAIGATSPSSRRSSPTRRSSPPLARAS